jgi:L-Ala-D/L-Glu epimerase
MQLSFKTIDLQLKHTFTIASVSRTFTPVVLTQIKYEGIVGYGEASMPPYIGENHETAILFLEKTKNIVEKLTYPFDIQLVMYEVDALAIGNSAAKASVDIALHDLKGQLENRPVWAFFGTNPATMPITSFTIGMDTPSVLRQKVSESEGFKILKIKLGSSNDKAIINTIREVTDKPLYVDANQGWKDKYEALEMTHWLKEKGVLMIEQPMLKTDLDGNAFVTEGSPLPTIADESCQRLIDIPRLKGVFHGINIKLMKSTGLNEGFKMLQLARTLGLKVMIGCMSETSCGVLAATQIAPMCDYVDLDTTWLITNNPFENLDLKEGVIQLSHRSGLGLKELKIKG